jgi:hypothetical protein
MYATWARAVRSAALGAPRPRVVATRCTSRRRHLHASAPASTAVPPPSAPAAAAPAAPGVTPPGAGDDATTDPSSSGAPPPPADDSGKSESGSGGSNGGSNSSQPPAPDRDENPFGEGGLNSSSSGGEARLGRQKRVIGPAARARSTRTRTQESLPPVQIPSSFPKRQVFRWEKGTESGGFYWRATLKDILKDVRGDASKHVKQMIEGQPFHEEPDVKHGYHDIFEAAAWSDAEVQEFRENPQAFDVASVSHRGYAMLMSAMMVLLEHQPGAQDPEAADEPLEDRGKLGELLLKWADEIGESSDSTSALKWYELYRHLERVHSPGWSHEARLAYLKDRFESKLRFHSSLGLLHHDSLLEATSSIRAELALTAPSGMKAADVKRPATVVNFPYCSGDSWPRAVVQNMAVELQADVLHLTSHDMAQIIGSYVGQNTTRAPGPIAMLGYKAAENSGRIRPPVVEQPDGALGLITPLSIVIPTDKMRKDGKKKMSIMDHLIGEPSRGKPDDLWEDLKISTALEELIHNADSDGPEQRPLIIHVHDFNALNMDDQGGAVVLSKLRKVVDTLWCEGRRTVLLGTCSSRRAPALYVSSLKELKMTERFVTLHAEKKIWPADKDVDTLQKDDSEGNSIVTAINSLEAKDFSDENATNISTMLNTLLALDDSVGSSKAQLNLHSWEAHQTLKTLSDRVLPASEAYRIATTMIGLQRRQSDVFDRSVVLEALRLVSLIDEGREDLAKSRSNAENDVRRNVMGGSSSSGSNSDHEERFASVLVNPKDIRTTFNDIHAPQETIDSIKMLTQLSLLRPEAFTYGVLSTDRIPGCLLYGPPGTGKTLLAKAVAKESGANMVEVSGASINNMYVGESEKNIRALFNLAKKKEPLVIFIDEADALLGARGGRNDAAGRRSVINQFLREWDGMDATKAFIMVATNRPFDLDEAVLRRLPRKLLVDLPLEKDRAAILRIHLRGETLDESVSIEQMAKQTPLYSGSDLKNVCVAAAMAAVKEELEASEKHEGQTPYTFPERRVLSRRHFDRGLAEIPASVSEDMATLNAIKKFDERYGERGARRKRRGMGFEVVPEATDSHEARVRGPGR